MTSATAICSHYIRRFSLPSLAQHQSNQFTKVLFLGDSKSGKTTALWSLVRAGYKLRILDFDNLLDSLKEKLLVECPKQLDNVEFRTLRDDYKAGPTGMVLDGAAKAFVAAMKMLDNWKYDEVDLGKPKEWGSDYIFVVDCLSRLCDAAYDFHASRPMSSLSVTASIWSCRTRLRRSSRKGWGRSSRRRSRNTSLST